MSPFGVIKENSSELTARTNDLKIVNTMDTTTVSKERESAPLSTLQFKRSKELTVLEDRIHAIPVDKTTQ